MHQKGGSPTSGASALCFLFSASRTSSRSAQHEVPGRGLSAFHSRLYGTVRHRLSFSRQNHCRDQLRPYLFGAQKDQLLHGFCRPSRRYQRSERRYLACQFYTVLSHVVVNVSMPLRSPSQRT